MEINDYIENRMEINQHGNFVKPKMQEVVTWVKNSWEKTIDSCIANALRAGYLDKKYSFKDSAIAKHEIWSTDSERNGVTRISPGNSGIGLL